MRLFPRSSRDLSLEIGTGLSVQYDCVRVFFVERLFQRGTVERSLEHNQDGIDGPAAEFWQTIQSG